MGKRGFQTQPAAIAIMKGIYRPSRHGSREALDTEYLTEVPQPPDGLGETGRLFWEQILSKLINIRGMIAVIDLPNFEQMAYNYEIVRICQLKIKEDGLVINDNRGRDIPNPFWTIYKEAQNTFIKLSREYGCTPAARNLIKMEGESEAIKLNSFSL